MRGHLSTTFFSTLAPTRPLSKTPPTMASQPAFSSPQSLLQMSRRMGFALGFTALVISACGSDSEDSSENNTAGEERATVTEDNYVSRPGERSVDLSDGDSTGRQDPRQADYESYMEANTGVKAVLDGIGPLTEPATPPPSSADAGTPTDSAEDAENRLDAGLDGSVG